MRTKTCVSIFVVFFVVMAAYSSANLVKVVDKSYEVNEQFQSIPDWAMVNGTVYNGALNISTLLPERTDWNESGFITGIPVFDSWENLTGEKYYMHVKYGRVTVLNADMTGRKDVTTVFYIMNKSRLSGKYSFSDENYESIRIVVRYSGGDEKLAAYVQKYNGTALESSETIIADTNTTNGYSLSIEYEVLWLGGKNVTLHLVRLAIYNESSTEPHIVVEDKTFEFALSFWIGDAVTGIHTTYMHIGELTYFIESDYILHAPVNVEVGRYVVAEPPESDSTAEAQPNYLMWILIAIGTAMIIYAFFLWKKRRNTEES